MLKNVPILITGANGMIGSRLTQNLVELGADVAITVRDKNNLASIPSKTLKNQKT